MTIYKEIVNALFKKRHQFESDNMRAPSVVEIYVNETTYMQLMYDPDFQRTADMRTKTQKIQGWTMNRCVNDDAAPYRILIE